MNQQNLSHFYIILFSTFYFHKIIDNRSYDDFTFFYRRRNLTQLFSRKLYFYNKKYIIQIPEKESFSSRIIAPSLFYFPQDISE